MIRVLSILALCLLPLMNTFAQEGNIPPALTDSSYISLITGSPGAELYTKFGHSAIRVVDAANGIDLVFNYGTFDFQTPGFYVKFVRGKLLYFLSVYEFRRMVAEYNYRDQSLIEQKLNLSRDEKQAVFNFLIKNYEPGNRFYLYDFFFDNCSSRIRDVFQEILNDSLVFKDSHIKTSKSFRQLIDGYLTDSPWGDFGIDLLLGLPSDRIASPNEYMFLPYDMMRAFENSTLLTPSGDNVNFAYPANYVFIEKEQGFPIPFFTPMKVFTALFVIVLLLSLLQLKSKFSLNLLDSIIFSVAGFVGIFLLFMWFGTDHIATKYNMNFLWALPTHVLIPFILYFKTGKPWAKYYLIGFILLNMILLIGWKVNPQEFNPAILPLILILTIRGVNIYINNFIRPGSFTR